MFDSILAQINAWIAAGTASWNDVIRQTQTALDDAAAAYENHLSIQNDAYEKGFGGEWASIETRLASKLYDLRLLARGINALSPGEPITGLGFVFPPLIAGLTVGGALFLIGSLYVVVSESFDFFLKVTGKAPPSGGRVDSLVKYGIVAAALVMLLPKLIKQR